MEMTSSTSKCGATPSAVGEANAPMRAVPGAMPKSFSSAARKPAASGNTGAMLSRYTVSPMRNRTSGLTCPAGTMYGLLRPRVISTRPRYFLARFSKLANTLLLRISGRRCNWPWLV
jgi:hypothetical protein